MSNTRVANNCHCFNTYHLAASGLVRSHILEHFRETRAKDVVILRGRNDSPVEIEQAAALRATV